MADVTLSEELAREAVKLFTQGINEGMAAGEDGHLSLEKALELLRHAFETFAFVDDPAGERG